MERPLCKQCQKKAVVNDLGFCSKQCRTIFERALRRLNPAAERAKADEDTEWDMDKLDASDWSRECEVCGGRPVVPLTGMCGPCTFGEAETVGGNW